MSCPGVKMSASEAATYSPRPGDSRLLPGVRRQPVEGQRRERLHAELEALFVDVEARAVVGRGRGRVLVRSRATHEVEEPRHLLLVEGEALRTAPLVDHA